MLLLNAIAEAGDVTAGASQVCRVMRQSEDGITTRIIYVSLQAINAGDVEQNLLLQPGDTVIVDSNKDTIYVNGHVDKPDKYDFTDGMTASRRSSRPGASATTPPATGPRSIGSSPAR